MFIWFECNLISNIENLHFNCNIFYCNFVLLCRMWRLNGICVWLDHALTFICWISRWSMMWHINRSGKKKSHSYSCILLVCSSPIKFNHAIALTKQFKESKKIEIVSFKLLCFAKKLPKEVVSAIMIHSKWLAARVKWEVKCVN